MAKNQSQVSTLDEELPLEQASAPVQDIKGENADDQLSGRHEMVTIHSSNEDGGSDAVFVSLNGFAYQIPRDKPYKVPAELVEILRAARVTNYKPGAAGSVIEDVRPRFAFSSQPI